MRSVRGGGGLVDRFGRPVPAAPVVRLRVDATPGAEPLLVDDVAVPVGRGTDPHRAGLAAAARRAARLGRPVRVELAGRWNAWPLVVHPDGRVDDGRAPLRGSWERRRATALAGVVERPRRRPLGVVAAAGALAAALLVGALGAGVGTGVVIVAAPSAAPAECRDVTLFAVHGSGAAGSETLAAVTDPLVQRVGERLAVVAVPGPPLGASYRASEQQAVTTLTDQVAAQLAACPDSRAMLFGYSQGAHVAGDVAARIGAGEEPRVPADRVLAVGLFGDPARGPGVRTVPAAVTGQGVLPARERGFGALAARTIEVCAPQDPVCATAAEATPPPLEQAVAAPAHVDYPQLTVAPDVPATRWASESLGRLITSLPAPADGGPAGGATSTPGTSLPPTSPPQTSPPPTSTPSEGTATGEAPAGGGDYPGEYGGAVTGDTGEAPRTTTPPAEDEDTGTTGGPGSGRAGEATDALWSMTSGLDGFQDSTGGNVEGGGLDPEEVASPNVPGRRVVKLEVPGGGTRSEVRPEEAQNIRAGQRLFFGYSAFLPSDFPVDTPDWQVIWQLHDGETSTSPPVALEIVDGTLWLAGVGDRLRDLGPVAAGRNLDVQMDIEFEVGGGSVTVYRGGRPVLQDFRPPRGTMIDSFDYLKTGIYRHGDGDAAPATIFLNDLKIGDTLASVSGLAGAEPGAGSGRTGEERAAR